MHLRIVTTVAALTLALGALGCAETETSTVEDEPSSSTSSATSTSTSSEDSGSEPTEEPEADPTEEPKAEAVTFGEGEASGEFAIAQASGTINAPKDVRILVSATPNQKASVTYTLVCSQGAGAGTKSGQFEATTPVDRKLPLAGDDPSDCIVSANAQLQGPDGEVKVRLRGTER
jgi:hypothetical protein